MPRGKGSGGKRAPFPNNYAAMSIGQLFEAKRRWTSSTADFSEAGELVRRDAVVKIEHELEKRRN